MTRDDIINLAREVADPNTTDPVFNDLIMLNFSEMERFVALVAAAEREACAKVCDDIADTNKWSDAVGAAAAIRARSQQ